MQYRLYPKHSVIYETGDFGQYYYFLLKGKLYQLLPTSEDIVQSPLKITNFRGPSNKPVMSLLALINCQKDVNSPRNLTKSMSKDLHRNSLNTSQNLNSSFQVDKEFQQYVPHHKFNQYILPGTGFGDTELFSRQRRGCTMYCDEESHVISISKEVFDQIMGEEKQKLIDEKNLFFSQFNFLEGINSNRLMHIIDTSITLKLNSKNIIYTEGSDCESLFFIRKGEVHLQKFLDNDASELNDPSKKILDEVSDLHKAMNRRKKKQERVPILVLGENSYFGDYEILKKIGERVTQAVCVSQECEIIEVKADKLLHLVKIFGKHKDLIKNELVRDEFMKERIELIQNQKQEQIQNRLVQEYSFAPKQQQSTINQEQRNRQQSMNVFSTPNQSSQNQLQPIIFKSDTAPKRIKAHTLSVQLDNQQNIFQKSFTNTQTPSLHRKILQQPLSTKDIEDQVKTNSNSNSPARFIIPKSERVIQDTQPVFIQQYPNGSLSTKSKNHLSPSYDFSIQESKGQIMEQIKQSQAVQEQLKQPSKQQKYQYKKFKSSTSVKDLLLPPQKGEISSNNHYDEFENMKNDINKNLFQTFVENAEKQVLQKQAIMQKLSNNKSAAKINIETGKPALFEDEFSKGFNNMFLRKFGKKFEKK